MKIVINTIASYSRTIVAIVLVLFSSRWVIGSLGVSDFGIYSLVGSILTIVIFINTVLANGNSRFISIAIGKNDKEELNNLFKTISVIHIIVPLAVIIIGYFVGVFAIKNWLEIPLDRIPSAIITYKVALIGSFFAIIAVPYTASFIANQNIILHSLINLFQTLMYFSSAFMLRYIKGDYLVWYACFICISNIITYSLFIILAFVKYQYCRNLFKSTFDYIKAWSIIQFAFWNFLGSFGHLCRTQGISLIVNLSFGPQGNAALGIANQVATQSANLTNALSSATAPEVYRKIGIGDYLGASKLCNSISKFGTFLILLLSVVMISDIDNLLLLWLRKVPENTAELCICFILMYIIEKIPIGLNVYLNGINKISLQQTLTFISYLLSIVLPYCGLMNIFGITGIGISCVLSMGLAVISTLYCYNRFTKYNAYPISLKLFISSMIIFCLTLLFRSFNNSLSLLFILKVIYASIILISILTKIFYSFIFNKNEKEQIFNFIKKICKK